MVWSKNNGFVAVSTEDALRGYYEAFKNNGHQDLSFSSFVDSAEYEAAYMAAQVDSNISIVFSELTERMKNFIRDSNEKITNPTTTANAIIGSIYDRFGFRCSVKEMVEEDSGLMHIAIDHGDISDNPDLKRLIGEHLNKYCIVGGIVTVGDIAQQIVLGRGGVETYKWTSNIDLPIRWRIRFTLSRNSVAVVDTPEEVIAKFSRNWNSSYWIGMDVEPEAYLTIWRDCPYAAKVDISYSLDDGVTWSSEIIRSKYFNKYIPSILISDVEFF